MNLEQKQVISFYQVPKYVKKEYLGLSYWLSIFFHTFILNTVRFKYLLAKFCYSYSV